MREETVSINGVLYDAKTGQPVKKPTPVKATSKPSTTVKKPSQVKKVAVRQPKKISVQTAPKPVKRKPAPSRTLNRQAVKKPTSSRQTVKTAAPKPKAKPAQQKKPASVKNYQPEPSRIMSRGVKRPKPAPIPQTTPKPVAKTVSKEDKKKRGLISLIVSACVLVIIAGVVLAYFFVPSFSVWVASERSGVNATLPVYTPTGYKVSGTAESSLGLVTINYHSDSTNNSYTLTQANSNWDSNGVLENKVKPLGGSHQTLSQKGLTIYRYTTGAVWVNGGVLYTITDEGKLSNEQILQIVDGI